MKKTTNLNLSADVADQTISELDLKKDIRALDKIIEHLDAIIRAREKARIGWIPERTFWDELIDVNCTPLGQDYDDGYHGTWDSLFEIWQVVGAHLSEAMSLYEKGSGWTTQK